MKKSHIILLSILLFIILISFVISKAHASTGADIPAAYAEAPLSSCPITTAEYVIVDAYTPSDIDSDYLDTFKWFTNEDPLNAPHYARVHSINFYHIDSSNREAAQACFGVAITNDTTTLVFKDGQLITQTSSENMSSRQLYQFLHSNPVNLNIY